jgi:hypothetical protein
MAGNGAERILNHYLMAQSVLRAQVMLRTAAPRLSLAALSCGCPADGVRHAFCSSSLQRRACVVHFFAITARLQPRLISARVRQRMGIPPS